MKHKWILIVLSILFFLTALTFWANRVIFPKVIRKIVVEQAEHAIHRRVEIESLRFNWIKGIFLKKIKIYQKDSDTEVLAQAEEVSLGFLFIPGFKQHKLILPFINIESPSVHLIHQGNNIWNFSDLLAPSVPNNNSPVAISVGNINVRKGKLRLDDVQSTKVWTEQFDQINLKAGPSILGIAMDASIFVPQKQGLISFNGIIRYFNQSFKTNLNLRNITPSDYLKLLPVQIPLKIMEGTIDSMLVNIEYTPEKISVRGDWSINHMNVGFSDYSIKSEMKVVDADIIVEKQSAKVRGSFSFNDLNVNSPTLSLAGDVRADVSNFVFKSLEDISIMGTIKSKTLMMKLSPDQLFQGEINADIYQGRWQKDSGNLEGKFNLHNAVLTLNDQRSFQGDLKLNEVSIHKEKDSIKAKGDLIFNQFDIRMPGQMIKGNLEAQGLTLEIDPQNNIQFIGPLDLNGFDLTTRQAKAIGTLHFKNLTAHLNQKEQTLEAQTEGSFKDLDVLFNPSYKLSTSADFKIQFLFPLKNPSALDYKGTITVDGAQFEGLPCGPLNDIRLNADIKTEQMNIKNLSLNILDAPITASGSFLNFSKPLLNIEVNSKSIDLGKLKSAAPEFIKAYGLNVNGTTSFQLKFEGLASDPLSGKINAEASLNDVSVESSVFKQSVKGVSGSLKADGSSLSWDHFALTTMGKTMILNGSLSDFKNPKVNTSLSAEGIELKAQFNKDNNLIYITNLSGRYQTAEFHVDGSVDISSKTPQLDVNGDLKFKLEDVSEFLPDLKKTIDPLKLKGEISINSSIQGPASDWKNWKSTSTAKSDLLSISGLKFKNVNLQMNQTDQKIQDCRLTSDLYQGSLNILSNIDLSKSKLPADISLKIENVDISQTIKDLKMTQDIRGQFNLSSSLKLSLINPLGVKGKGNVVIREAYLSDIELFKGLLAPLRVLIPGTSNLILNEVEGNYTVEDQMVTTDNLQLKGNLLILLARGHVGFDQSIQMTVDAPEEYNQSSPLPPEIRQLIKYNIDGKVSEPKIKHNMSKVKSIINIGKTILGDKLPKILDIFSQ